MINHKNISARIFLAFLCFIPLLKHGANLDSLRQIAATSTNDSVVFNARKVIGYELLAINKKQAMAYGDSLVKDAKKANNFFGQMHGWVIQANGYLSLRNYDSSLVCFQRAVKAGQAGEYTSSIDRIQMFLASSYSRLTQYDRAIEELKTGIKWAIEDNDTSSLIMGYSNSGHNYFTVGNYNKALESYLTSLNLAELTKDIASQAKTQTNLGVVYREKKDYKKSITYFLSAIENYKKIPSPIDVAGAQARLGHVYILTKETALADSILKEAIIIQTKNNDEYGLTSTYNSLGFLHKENKNHEQSTKYYKKAVELARKTDNTLFLGGLLINLGSAYYLNNQTQKSIAYLKEGVEIAKNHSKIEYMSVGYDYLSKAYNKLGAHKNAFNYLKLHLALKDSMLNIANLKQMNELEAKYENEKKEREIMLLNEKSKVDSLAVRNAKHKSLLAEEQKKSQQLLFGLGIGLLLIIIIFIFIGYQNKRKSNLILLKQKEEIEQANKTISLQRDIVNQKNKEIVDSINYAKRIQTAILPAKKLISKHLSNSFILYKPKDIVAGDFYWFEPLKDKLLIAAADCTGHGVPGAMVSVVCNNALNRSVREFGLNTPGKILDKTREIVLEEFIQSSSDVKDGMDLALCAINKTENGVELEYAGAYNPLWIIRKDSTTIEEIKADKEPIGSFDALSSFNTHTIKLTEGDTFYIFTDGFADQFGGEKGKKLKPINFKNLLLSIVNEPLQTQVDKLNESFENWRGELEQVDDICVIGVRI